MFKKIGLPKVIVDYIAASNSKDISKVASLFTNEAVVKDEGNSYNGIKEIIEWQSKIHTAYDFQMSVKKATDDNNIYIVETTLSGNFPGKNPVDVEQYFEISEDKIAVLDIR